jgi:oxygen-independent coproporphyrinogen-3 oxidase
MAPSTVKADKLRVLKDMGVTRISMGVQSFDPDRLSSLGRLHSPKQIYQAWERILEVGFPQTNLDLIFAIPNQSIGQWETDIREAARLGPDHISTYCLTFEEDTALYVKLAQGKVRIDEEKEIRFYERAWELLDDLGYRQYEISNFARPGCECRHNLNTWRMQEWIGCGPSAASQFQGERFQRPANLEQWARSMFASQPPKEETVALDDHLLLTDSAVFGLRMNRGIDLGRLRRRFPEAGGLGHLEDFLERLAKEELLVKLGEVCRLTHRGRLLADAIGSELIERTIRNR